MFEVEYECPCAVELLEPREGSCRCRLGPDSRGPLSSLLFCTGHFCELMTRLMAAKELAYFCVFLFFKGLCKI